MANLNPWVPEPTSPEEFDACVLDALAQCRETGRVWREEDVPLILEAAIRETGTEMVRKSGPGPAEWGLVPDPSTPGGDLLLRLAPLTNGQIEVYARKNGEWSCGMLALYYGYDLGNIAHLTTTPRVMPVSNSGSSPDSMSPAAETQGDACSWLPVDVSDAVHRITNGLVTRPVPTIGRLDGRSESHPGGLLYPGRVCGIAGDSNAGKSMTALAICAQEVAAGSRVIYVDYEDRVEGVVGRLLEIGCPPHLVAANFLYCGPVDRLSNAGRAALESSIREHTPTLVVLDSVGEGLSLDRRNPNADDEVAAWFQDTARWFARLGPCCLLIDHITKSNDGDLWPIGSQRKRAAIDGVQYMLRVVEPFSRERDGHSVLVCAKDRHGNYHQGQKVAAVHVRRTNESGGTAVELVAIDSRTSHSSSRSAHVMEKASIYIENTDDPKLRSKTKIAAAVRGNAATARKALDALVSEGFVICDNTSQTHVYTSVQPFRADVDARGQSDNKLRSDNPDPGPVP